MLRPVFETLGYTCGYAWYRRERVRSGDLLGDELCKRMAISNLLSFRSRSLTGLRPGRRPTIPPSKNISRNGPQNCRSLGFARDDKGKSDASMKSGGWIEGVFHHLGWDVGLVSRPRRAFVEVTKNVRVDPLPRTKSPGPGVSTFQGRFGFVSGQRQTRQSALDGSEETKRQLLPRPSF
jgi:hypothetical protein